MTREAEKDVKQQEVVAHVESLWQNLIERGHGKSAIVVLVYSPDHPGAVIGSNMERTDTVASLLRRAAVDVEDSAAGEREVFKVAPRGN